MLAPVLTRDHYRVITEPMIGQYARSWPGHPLFVFRIPCHAVFGESTKAGRITQNCHERALAAGLTLPAPFTAHNGWRGMMGRL